MVKRIEEIKRYCYTEDYSAEFDFCRKLDFKNYLSHSCYFSTHRKILNTKELKKLERFFNKCVRDYIKNVLQDPEIKVFVADSWVAKQDTGQSVHSHKHHNRSLLIGVFYFNVPDDSTPLILHLGIDKKVIINVQSGELIIFENKFKHSVAKNNNKNTRFCLSFNLWAKEKISLQNCS
tara:strand:- start:229 stop:762 length:534 start_codon:yes stop_codon:yes gene_type:complete